MAFAIASGIGSDPALAGWPKPAGGESASGDPEIIFTFDDGPHKRNTAAILDELGARGIQAIFFWVGWRVTRGSQVPDNLALVRRAVDEGHVVANHTISHADLCQVKIEQAIEEIDDNAALYAEATGLPMVLFRAPYGAHCQRLIEMLADRSLDHMHWDMDPQEWEHHDPKRTLKYMIRKLKRLDGRAIVLMHDTHRVTARALPKILDWIDKENERRAKSGKKRPIRVLSGVDLLIERLDTPLLDWMARAALHPANRIHSALPRLIP